MLANINAVADPAPTQTTRKNAHALPGSEGFVAAIEQVMHEEHRRVAIVSESGRQQGAALRQQKDLAENGKALKFPLDEDILLELLDTVKTKIGQLKQLKEDLDQS